MLFKNPFLSYLFSKPVSLLCSQEPKRRSKDLESTGFGPWTITCSRLFAI